MRTTLAPVLVLVLLLFAIASGGSDQQQQRQRHPGSSAAISEVPASNDSTRPSSSQVPASSEVAASSEEEAEDDNEKEEPEEDAGTDAAAATDDDNEDEGEGEEEDDDEYEDELKAESSKHGRARGADDDDDDDKEVSELLEYKRKSEAREDAIKKEKRKATVKKELNARNRTSQPELQPLSGPRSYEEASIGIEQQQPAVPAEELTSHPGDGDGDEEAMLPRPSMAELSENIRSYIVGLPRGNVKRLYVEGLLRLLSELSEDPGLWERVHHLLNLLKLGLENSQRTTEIQKRLVQGSSALGTSRLTTSRPDRTTRRPKWKKKKKKKKKPRQRKPRTTTTSPVPTVKGLPTTEPPWATPAPRWRLAAERLFSPPWDQDDSSIAKVRYSMPSKPRTMTSSMRRPLDDDDDDVDVDEKEQLQRHRDDGLQALNSERQALMLEAAREYSQPRPLHYGKINTHQYTSEEDPGDGFGRPHQRPVHFGQLIPSTSSRQGYPRVRNPFDSNFGRNQDFSPGGREYAPTKTWRNGYRQMPQQNSWNWEQPKSWLQPERDYFEEAEEEDKSWEQPKHWRGNLRDNLPPWLEEKEIQRVLQTSSSWAQPEKSREDSSRNNVSEFKHGVESKESPKLTMKTWDSLTSDPATWPFKLPGAKPWPKDENGKSYNPNADLVRKLGIYSKNERLQEKQQKLQKQEKPNNSWLEPDEQQSAWFNNLKPNWNNESPAGRVEEKSDWNLSKASNKWNKQFAYHKVTAQPTSKVSLEKPGGRNAFIAVSAVSAPKYGNEWMKNDIEEVGREDGAVDSDHPSSQMRMNLWKKSTGVNGPPAKVDVLENQLENLKEPVLLEVNVSIKNSTTHHTSDKINRTTSSPSTNDSTTKYSKTGG